MPPAPWRDDGGAQAQRATQDQGRTSPAPGMITALELLDPRSPVGLEPGHHWFVLGLGGSAVGRARVIIDARGRVDHAAIARAAAEPATSRAIAAVLSRGRVEQLWRGGPIGIAGAAAALRQPEGTHGELPGLTAAICTRDRPEQLARALASLALDPACPVLVVNNGTADSLARVPGIDRHGVTVVHEPRRGLSMARNRALRTATTPIVGFLDDDTVVAPGWRPALQRAFHDAPEACAFCGLVEPLELDSPGAQAVEACGVMGRGHERIFAHARTPAGRSLMLPHGNTSRLGVGANLAVRRDVALQLGGFDEALGAGTPSRGGEDLEFLFRAQKAGYAAGYEPLAMLHHEHRPTLVAALEQAEGWGTGMRAYLERTGCAYPEERLPARLLLAWLVAAHYSRRALASFLIPGFPRAMLWRDLRGLRAGAARYREAAQGAPAPAAPRADASRPPGPTRREAIDLREPVTTIEAPDAARLELRVTLEGSELGTLALQPVRGVVGRARIVDAVAGAFRTQLLGVPDREAGAALLAATASPRAAER